MQDVLHVDIDGDIELLGVHLAIENDGDTQRIALLIFVKAANHRTCPLVNAFNVTFLNEDIAREGDMIQTVITFCNGQILNIYIAYVQLVFVYVQNEVLEYKVDGTVTVVVNGNVCRLRFRALAIDGDNKRFSVNLAVLRNAKESGQRT